MQHLHPFVAILGNRGLLVFDNPKMNKKEPVTVIIKKKLNKYYESIHERGYCQTLNSNVIEGSLKDTCYLITGR